MSKLIKQILKEDSEAVKFRYSSGSATDTSAPAIKVFTLSNRLVFDLTKLPNEVQFNLPDDIRGRSDYRFDSLNALSQDLSRLEKTDPEKAKQIRSDMIDELVVMDEQSKDLAKKISDEYEEIFEHLKQMLRASIIEYHHDHQEFLKSASEKIKAKYQAKINSQS